MIRIAVWAATKLLLPFFCHLLWGEMTGCVLTPLFVFLASKSLEVGPTVEPLLHTLGSNCSDW